MVAASTTVGTPIAITGTPIIRKNTEETVALIFNCSNDTKEFNEYAGQYNLLGESVFDGKVEGYDAAVLLCDSY